jgi:hypothetical protein
MTACQKAMEGGIEKIKPDSGMMQSTGEHQDVPRRGTVVNPVKGWKKWHGGWMLTLGRPGEPKELT